MPSKVSFIIPAYNEEKFIVECVETCLNQDYEGEVEVCVTDDGSTDNTFEVLENAFSENSNVKLHRFESNQGKVPAFNQSFAMASGDYILPMGADDICVSTRVSKQVKALEEGGKELVWSGLEVVDESGAPKSNFVHIAKSVSKDKIIEDNFVPGGTACFTRAFAEAVFPIPNHLKFEDWWIGFNAVIQGTHSYCEGSVIKYRLHADNTVGNTKGQYAVVRRKNIRRHFAYYDEFRRILKLKGETFLLKKVDYCELYKKACMSDSIFERTLFFIKSFTYFSPTFLNVTFKFFFVTILGLQGIGKIKGIMGRD